VTIEKALDTVLRDCLGVKEGENVLVITDPTRLPIGRALVDRARELGAETVLSEMSERPSNGSEPAAVLAPAMLEADVLIAPTAKSLSHTAARKAATEAGVRTASMPQITEDMLARTMAADFSLIRKRSAALAEALSAGSQVRIWGPGGTDLSLSIEGRKGLSDDGNLRSPGAFGNLPAGEGFIAPVEGAANGTLAFDGSVWPVGKLEEPIVIEIKDGYAESMSGRSAEEFRSALEPYGRDAFAVAELGIGTNEAATLTGNVLEDEKILGTVHVALGDNHSFGGTTRVSSHQDGIVLDASVEIDGNRVMDEGRLAL
jgi:leucyl aminopeptidase (aminopeptidase T)